MTLDHRTNDLLMQVFDLARERNKDEHFDEHMSEFVFHMTDWHMDLKKLHEMYSSPESWDPNSACEILIGFMYHVIPHLNAAGQLLVDEVRDPFSKRS